MRAGSQDKKSSHPHPQKRALITGINGMDGSHLADLLLHKGYRVWGVERRSSTKQRANTAHLSAHPDFKFVTGDVTDATSIQRIIQYVCPHEVYNLAAQSFVGASWDIPLQTTQATGLGCLNVLEAIRLSKDRRIRFYQASSSEMFGNMQENPASEKTPFYPRSPYGVAKLYAHWMTVNYRESHGMFACSGILFNHESERRGLEFVTRKITDGVARIYWGIEDHISLGNLESSRDWGYAPDYVEGMWQMLQQDKPDDYVLATGESYSIRDFLDVAFALIGIGGGSTSWEEFVRVDPRFYRPAEVDVLRGDASKAREKLGWKHSVSFKNMVYRMLFADILDVWAELSVGNPNQHAIRNAIKTINQHAMSMKVGVPATEEKWRQPKYVDVMARLERAVQ